MGHEYKLLIDGSSPYGMSDIASAKIEQPLFDTFSVGNTCSAELDITVWIKGVIPKMARLIPLVHGTEGGEDVWLTIHLGEAEAGTYSVDIPDFGKYAVVLDKGVGFEARVMITGVFGGEVTAQIERWNALYMKYEQPEKMTIYPAEGNSFPELSELAYETEEERATQLGVFFIDTREQVGDRLHIVAYDAMMRGNVVWVPDEKLQFPMPMDQAVQVICDLMGLELDSRTVLSSSYTIDHPANGWTLRDVLGFIGAAHAGNWIITARGKLLLVPLFDSMPKSSGYLVSENGSAITFGGVRIRI